MRTLIAIMAIGALAASQAASAEPGRRSTRPGPAAVAPAPVDRNGANGSDNCIDAHEITGLGAHPFDNTAATTDGLPQLACLGASGGDMFNDLWWRWTSTVSGTVSISTCGLTTLDTLVAVYMPTAICTPGDESTIVCADAGCGPEGGVTFIAALGQEYLIRIGSFVQLNAAAGPIPTGTGEFLISGSLSPCAPAYCQEFDPQESFGYISDAGIAAADDFIAGDSFITFVCFKGDYDSTLPTPGPDDVRVTYYADGGGIPGQVLAQFDAGSGLLLEGPVATGETVEGSFTQFELKASHPPVPVLTGERYWVEVRNLAPTNWYWSHSPQGNGVAIQRLDGEPYISSNTFKGDLSLCVGPIDTCPTDVDNDGDTDFADLNRIISSFNTVCP